MKNFAKSLLLTAALLTALFTTAAQPSDYIPADSTVYGAINVSEILNQPLFKAAIEQQLKNELTARGLTLEDICGKAAFGITYASDKPTENLACSVIFATDKAGAARKLFTATAMDMQKTDSAKKVRIGKKQAIQGPGYRLILESPQMLVLQAINGTVKQYQDLTVRTGNPIAKYSNDSIVAAVDLRTLSKLLANQLPPEQLKEFDGLETMLVTVKFTADGGVNITLNVTHATPEKCSATATQYAQTVEMFKTDPAVAATVSKVTAKSNGKDFTIRANFTQQELQNIAAQVMMMVMSAVPQAAPATPAAQTAK